MRKKILFVITKSEMGGAQRFLFKLVTRLDRNVYDMTIASGSPGELLDKLTDQGYGAITLKHLKNDFGLGNISAFFELRNLIRKIKPDILYLNSSMAGFIGGFAGRLAFWRNRPKIIYRIGGWSFKEPRSIIIKKILLWAEKFSSPFKDLIIVNSEFDRKLALKHKMTKPRKIITIHNGVDFDEIEFMPKIMARYFIEKKIALLPSFSTRISVGAIANLYRNKGLEYLIGAAALLKEKKKHFQIVIIGEGEERFHLENLIEKHQLKDRVFLIGYVADAYRYLKAFDIFVLPSIKEGQPWVILEAMAAEVPIVAANIAGIPEMIENEKSGLLVEPADSDALAQALEKILIHPSLAQEITKNALERVKEKFNIETMIKKNQEQF